MTSTFKPLKYRVYLGENGMYYSQVQTRNPGGTYYWDNIDRKVSCRGYVFLASSTKDPVEAERQCREHANRRLDDYNRKQKAGVYKELGELP